MSIRENQLEGVISYLLLAHCDMPDHKIFASLLKCCRLPDDSTIKWCQKWQHSLERELTTPSHILLTKEWKLVSSGYEADKAGTAAHESNFQFLRRDPRGLVRSTFN